MTKALINVIQPEWPAPPGVRAYSTLREGGVSTGLCSGLNLGLSTPDDPANVKQNRLLLKEQLHLPTQPSWLHQTHSNTVIQLPNSAPILKADASFSEIANVVCIVMTADCLPILLCDNNGEKVAAVHAGWRGLSQGIIKNALSHFQEAGENLLAWLGPAISVRAFIVGPDVYDAFVTQDKNAESAFHPATPGKYYADLYTLAKLQLQQLGVTKIYGGDRCTYTEHDCFYSYRRESQTGRMATLIWRE